MSVSEESEISRQVSSPASRARDISASTSKSGRRVVGSDASAALSPGMLSRASDVGEVAGGGPLAALARADSASWPSRLPDVSS